jgi:hypothetical protein
MGIFKDVDPKVFVVEFLALFALISAIFIAFVFADALLLSE